MSRTVKAGEIDRELMDSLISQLPDEQARGDLLAVTEPVVRSLASRFGGRGEPIDDLIQVASIGMLKAIDNFDPERGDALLAYATATIVGELRHYFRDSVRPIRLPRRLVEARRAVDRCVDDLTQLHGRSPSVSELAECADLDEESVLEAIASVHAARPAPLHDISDGPPMELRSDLDYGRILDLHTISRHLMVLEPRERRIIFLRFFRGFTQAEIAREIGISQVQVSRILTTTLREIRQATEGSQ